MIKKGAMFGLDARIALAIFGALSVISGAALYNAIQSSKMVVTMAQAKEITKAIEAYYLDTGAEIPLSFTGVSSLKIDNLINKPAGVNNWNGPYLSHKKIATYGLMPNANVFHRQENMLYYMVEGFKDTWPTEAVDCDADMNQDSECYYWLTLYYPHGTTTSATELFNMLDQAYDNSDGYLTGDIRRRSNQEVYIRLAKAFM